ncbi:MAG: NAD(P)H-dependent oxidoreductase subunit E [Oscillospiraceae bacterium]|nr:NAD(P)H-dependent oxidoreductase subunit E [Oscillospiraceae bacterium]
MKKIVIDVCFGSGCILMGAMDIVDAIEMLKKLKGDKKVKAQICVNTCKCSKECNQKDKAPVVFVNGEKICKATPETVTAKIYEIAKNQSRGGD